jgi:hypothetical protein
VIPGSGSDNLFSAATSTDFLDRVVGLGNPQNKLLSKNLIKISAVNMDDIFLSKGLHEHHYHDMSMGLCKK